MLFLLLRTSRIRVRTADDGFRRQSLAWRFVISVPVSISNVPILAYWLDKLGGLAAVWISLFALLDRVRGSLATDAYRGEIRLFGPLSRASVAFVPAGGSMGRRRLRFTGGFAHRRGSLVYQHHFVGPDLSHIIHRCHHANWNRASGESDRLRRWTSSAPLPLFLVHSLQPGGPSGRGVSAGAERLFCRYHLVRHRPGVRHRSLPALFHERRPNDFLKLDLQGRPLLAVTGLDVIPTFPLDLPEHPLYGYGGMERSRPIAIFASWAPHSVGALVAGVTALYRVSRTEA